MGHKVKNELSKKNKYWISKHRQLELKHFCMQYPTWVDAYNSISSTYHRATLQYTNFRGPVNASIVDRHAEQMAMYSDKINMVRDTAMLADDLLYPWILEGVTNGHSYEYLQTKLNIPCSRDTYYDRYRKFFWLLNRVRN